MKLLAVYNEPARALMGYRGTYVASETTMPLARPSLAKVMGMRPRVERTCPECGRIFFTGWKKKHCGRQCSMAAKARPL